VTGVRRALAGAALLGAGAVAYGAGVEVRSYRLRRVTVPVLPPGTTPLRVLHLSDLHITPRQRHVRAWVDGLAALRPDLVVSTGDHLAHVEAVPAALAAYDRLLDIPGVFVFGSNDYYAPKPKNPTWYLRPDDGVRTHGPELPWADLRDAFRERGWLDLTNASARLDVAGVRLAFRGVDDPHLFRDDYTAVREHAGGTVGTRPAEEGAALGIGVTHSPEPRVLDAMAMDGLGLLLAGHTHGGQLCVPGFGALVTNCGLPRAQAKGLSRWGPSYLHVSAGLGTSPYARIRFACPPEATLLTLVARGAPDPAEAARGLG
jgi:predicted MPP superfamily phosphohydrolase